MILALPVGAFCAPTLSAEQTAEATAFCTVGKSLVEGCLDAYAESFDYTDDYMKAQPIKRAAQLVYWATVQQRMDTKASQAAAISRRNAATQAKRSASCKAAGLEPDTVRIGLSTADVKSCGWGEPDTVKEFISASQTLEMWFYKHGGALTFRNGSLYLISR